MKPSLLKGVIGTGIRVLGDGFRSEDPLPCTILESGFLANNSPPAEVSASPGVCDSRGAAAFHSSFLSRAVGMFY